MTHPELGTWPTQQGRSRQSEVSALVGHGEEVWEHAAGELLNWGVKTRSGFEVPTRTPVAAGQKLDITARLFGVRVLEPVEVISVVREPNRVGFAYRTLPGHPVPGEEAFILELRGTQVHLTVRSVTRPSPQQPWRAAFPLLLAIQLVVRRRYLRALRP